MSPPSRKSATFRFRQRQALSLVETLVAVLIVGFLSVLLLPAFEQARARSNTSACISNQRALFSAAQGYANDTGAYPTSMNNNWQRQLAPYLGITIAQGENPGVPPCPRNAFLCPSVKKDPQPWRSYAVNSRAGDNDGATDEMAVRISLASQTVLLADGKNTSWISSVSHISTRHNGGFANVLFFDGHVETLNAEQMEARVSTIFISGAAR